MESIFEKVNKFLKDYGGYISIVLYILLVIVINYRDPYKLVTKYKELSILLTLIFGFIVVTFSNFISKRDELFGDNNDDNDKPSIFKGLTTASGSLGILIVAGLLIYGLSYVIFSFGRFLSIFYSFLFYLSIIAGLGILYKLAAPYLTGVNSPKFIKLLRNIIFYLPCLLIDLIENIAGTKKSVWILLLIEIIVITAYFGIPAILRNKNLKKGTVLASDPQHLNSLGTLDSDALRNIINESKKKMQYALSAEIWIDPQPTSTSVAYTQDTNILSFGDRLRVEYNGKNADKLIIKALEGKETVVVAEPNIALQKWNKIVLNYDHGILDIFLNGELIHSQQNVPYVNIASVQSGSNKGVYGGIKNIRFFEKPLTKNEMYII